MAGTRSRRRRANLPQTVVYTPITDPRFKIPVEIVRVNKIVIAGISHTISIDIPASKINLMISDEELEKRRAAWTPRAPKVTTGWIGRYARLVTSANTGAVLK